ncbi:Uncharacterised protein [Enterobacter cloacae]|nr:Uncharacterised protein [Enterobacter cloacae]
MDQVAVLRIDGGGEGDPFFRQLTFEDLAHLHTVQDQRLPGFNTVAFRCIQRNRQHARFLQQGFICRRDNKVFVRRTFAGDQLKGASRQQRTDAGVAEGELRITQFNARFFPQEIHHARIHRHFAGNGTARIEA